MSIVEALAEHRLLGIIRGNDPDACVETARTLLAQGVEVLEVSLTSRDALTVLGRLAGSARWIGAGTVLTARDARRARDAGATFAVTPALGEGVTASIEMGLPVLAGALTPTEVHAAVTAGAAAVKLFPASEFGPDYLAALRAPFPGVPFVPVGGISVEDVPRYLAAGALAVGVGSPLVGDAPDGGDLSALADRAARFVKALS
ncbi:aldolase [Lentzea pudingi]|uniref:Aldolase n=1 Tax=Lentzea pudingi TaxID=1789439 RepID=A0ABQ2I132_9PSEU|nr:bifunctional 4-hydroxy-2-oxoglutarate aldolase/2-dehydro-3-deoxy-phosphogluconate aldolase [Lentzea pudingi]GGM94662.1 aldolase [Lentzea pudingi]